jgi:CheY-like chemotaxis protein
MKTEECGQNGTSLRILHLEDDPVDAELVKYSLEEHGIPCSITRVCTREAFGVAIEQGGIDIILSDSKLPGFDTMSALQQVRETHPSIPFIFVTGNISPKAKVAAFLGGAADFINKDDLPRLSRTLKPLAFANKLRRVNPQMPEIGAPVMVQCKEFRCLGYLGRDGKWRDFGTSVELPEVTDWFSM